MPATPESHVPVTPEPREADGIDRAATIAALHDAAKRARPCAIGSRLHGHFRIAVTFAVDGRVTRSHLEGRETNGTLDDSLEWEASHADVRLCVERAFGEAEVPPFHGVPVTVHKSFSLDQTDKD